LISFSKEVDDGEEVIGGNMGTPVEKMADCGEVRENFTS
jgi:hypothetical protein